MGFGVVEFAEVATHEFITLLAKVTKLVFIATAVHFIKDVVVLV